MLFLPNGGAAGLAPLQLLRLVMMVMASPAAVGLAPRLLPMSPAAAPDSGGLRSNGRGRDLSVHES